ncbi:glycosyltransferase [Flavihumibacter petaseus]|uniref:Putative glycosyltransferase n=1 Tax=Flavihumibacter petaseus NBRC 106054 TaxID=1220578 RepID=A0A0E9N466_9BACT|nr:nucleotide disphospho-sugar-binding domain-containing protein [Flavihumibacter petaseus]GAO44619.1 putative glycosyltransferase [Flavihumibacter petaseus NBRC 106054]
MKQSTAKKILFANVPADGHFNPLTGIAVFLKDLGYDVRWYTSAKYAGKVKKLGLQYYPYKVALEVDTDNLSELFPDREKISSKIGKLNYDVQEFFLKRGPEYYTDILGIYREFPFDLMISDVMFTGNAFVKNLMNIPVMAIGIMPLAEGSVDLPPAGLGMHPSKSFFGRRKQAALRWLTDHVLFAKSIKVMYALLDKYGIRHGKENFFDMLYRQTDLVLQSGSPSFEYERSDISDNVRFIGPLLPYQQPAGRDTWMDHRVHHYDRVILVTQGTVETDVNKLLVPTLEAYKDSNTLVVVTTGGGGTAKLREAYPQANIIIEDFIPFNDIMPYVDVYITNGGYGGVLLGIENQLPFVVAGVHEGKNEICARIGYFRLGIDLRTETPKPSQIKGAVEKVLADGSYRKNVQQLSREFNTYKPLQLAAGYVQELLLSNPQPRFIHPEAIVY